MVMYIPPPPIPCNIAVQKRAAIGNDSAFLAIKKLVPVSTAKNFFENHVNWSYSFKSSNVRWIYTVALMANTSLLPFLSDSAE
jgi:hypothetical protein